MKDKKGYRKISKRLKRKHHNVVRRYHWQDGAIAVLMTLLGLSVIIGIGISIGTMASYLWECFSYVYTNQ